MSNSACSFIIYFAEAQSSVAGDRACMSASVSRAMLSNYTIANSALCGEIRYVLKYECVGCIVSYSALHFNIYMCEYSSNVGAFH